MFGLLVAARKRHPDRADYISLYVERVAQLGQLFRVFLFFFVLVSLGLCFSNDTMMTICVVGL